MLDLSARAGFPVLLDRRTGELHFGADVAPEAVGTRTIGELGVVLADAEAAVGRENEIAYHLYRGAVPGSDADTLAAHGLRYDLTITLPGDIGGELFKTAGHIHSEAPGGVGYPEIYDVLHGSAAFLLQFADPLRVAIAICGAGERILIPPGASHLTVNLGGEPLVVADLVAIASRNDYGEFREHRGAAVYVMRDEVGWSERINPNYPERPIWTVREGSRVGDFVPGERPLFADVARDADEFAWLTAPAPRAAEMRSLWRFVDPERSPAT